VPLTRVALYRESDGSVPFLDWFDELAPKAQDKCRVKIERLRELGFELRRPEVDFLRDGIYELRVGLHHVNYRTLYFFHGRQLAVISHGITKERAVPAIEIDRAIRRRANFARDPRGHTHEE